ncbi:MAG: hypothetical protein LBC28_06030, partial [Oscillospiraceae bacterium]|nr:hypothetical protein [Oscillospiraceae bacterium]
MNKKHKKDDGLPRVSFLKTLLKSLEIYFKASPLICVGNLSNAIMLGVGSMLITLFTQRFFDAVSAAAAGSGTLPSLIGPLTALGGAYLAVSLFGGIDGLTYNVMLEKFKTEAVRRVHVKMGRLDPVCLEDARLHDQLEKTAQGADSLQLITGIGVWSVLDHIGYLIFMSAYLSFVSPRLILAMLCVFLPTIIGQLLKMRVKADFEDEAAPIRRRYSFYERSVTHREFFKETRLLGAFSMLLGRFLEACAELTRAELRENRRSRRIEAVITLITALGWCGVIFLLVYSLVRGEITLGVFAAVFTSVETMFEMMEAAFRNIGR